VAANRLINRMIRCVDSVANKKGTQHDRQRVTSPKCEQETSRNSDLKGAGVMNKMFSVGKVREGGELIWRNEARQSRATHDYRPENRGQCDKC
jgi:hypothetical protein